MARKISTRIQKQIISLLKETPGVPVNRKHMSHTLKIGKREYKIFMNSLVDLAKSGKIVHVRKFMYAYPQKHEQMTGELRTTRAGYGFVTVDDQELDVFISEPNLNTAFDRDIVEIQLYASSRGKRLEGFVTKVLQRFRK
jgi:exoribonuclease R